MGFLTGLGRLLGVPEDDYEEGQIVDYPERRGKASESEPEQRIIDMPGAATDASVCIFRPRMEGGSPGFSMRELAGHLLARKPVIVDVGELATTDLDEATRIVDYLSGVSEAVNGVIYEMAKNIFVFLPSNIALEGDDSLKRIEVY